MISKEKVEHVARLAKLKLTDEEIERFTEELSKVIDYIGELDKINTDEVEPTAQVSGLTNQARSDQIINSDNRQSLLEQAKANQGDLIKTNKIL